LRLGGKSANVELLDRDTDSGGTEMCDNCENDVLNGELDERQIAGIALATIGGLIETYLDEGYCDPTMWQALSLGEKLSQKLGEHELAERFAFAKIQGGEVINSLIEANGLDIEKTEWS
jgi:hypothetical protein